MRTYLILPSQCRDAFLQNGCQPQMILGHTAAKKLSVFVSPAPSSASLLALVWAGEGTKVSVTFLLFVERERIEVPQPTTICHGWGRSTRMGGHSSFSLSAIMASAIM